jgi:hypothetical protein
MKVGDMVERKNYSTFQGVVADGPTGLFMGFKTFANMIEPDKPYTCSEVMWFKSGHIRTIQSDLIKVINEVRQ